MKEFLEANGNIYECESVTTGIDSITFTIANGNATDLEQAFRTVSSLTTTLEGEENPSGYYDHLKFDSITTHEDGSVSVTMHIKGEVERRLDALEEGQEILNGAVMELGQEIGGV